jgi:integrase
MFFEKHDERDDYKIWLSQEEIETFLTATSDSQHQLAFELAVRCGLRSDEVLRVCPRDLKDTEAGRMLRVDSAKSDGKRQTPIPYQVATRIEAINDVRPEPNDEPLIDRTTRTLRRWISATGEELEAETDEEMWGYLTMHDLRRTWATSLKGADVDAMIVCDWGGWSDLDTFLDHYRGKFSPEAQRQQREKVDWL